MEAILAGMSDECGERVNDLQRHKQDVHAVQGQKRFACEKCPAVYVHKRTLWQHTKDKHCRKSKGTLVLPPEHDGESDENTMTIIISHDLAEKIANSIESLENHGADDQEGFNQAEVAPENVPGPTEEPIDVGNADDFYQNLRFDLEMAKMDNSSMELDLHLSDASDPVLHEDMENILIIDHNDDGGLFTGGHLSVGKNNATGQNCDDVFVDIESIDDEGA
ncbi:hypothetical protein AAVH_39969 [Aphelenchoides avenae]|nr:hypothetical protein AAVH_39969 [Aphelenchus avenae]